MTTLEDVWRDQWGRLLALLIVDEQLRQDASAVLAVPSGLITDQRLRLILLCAHPALATESAAALTLRLVLGLPTADIARLFLVSELTMAARLTRAKRRLATIGAPFAIPAASAIDDRLGIACDVIYLAFTSGYAPTSGSAVTRIELAGEAIRLAGLLRELRPRRTPTDSGPVDALLALMLLQHSRRDARIDDHGAPVLLSDQDRTLWHQDEIAAALQLLTPLLDRAVAAASRNISSRLWSRLSMWSRPMPPRPAGIGLLGTMPTWSDSPVPRSYASITRSLRPAERRPG